MNKQLTKALNEANKKLKKNGIFNNFKITVEGNFKDEFNDVCLSSEDGRQHFPIASVETEGEAIAAISAYMSGLSHGKDNSYPKICNKEY